MTLSKSPERNTFQRDSYIKSQAEKGMENEPETEKMVEWYNNFAERKLMREQDPEWQKNNLEYDLRSTDWMLQKVRESDDYAQNLYAAMCNNDFMKKEIITILKEEVWHCSWRYAGGIIADMRQEGDYIDWYCSGIGAQDKCVGEGTVTDEIRDDLQQLGWIVIADN